MIQAAIGYRHEGSFLPFIGFFKAIIFDHWCLSDLFWKPIVVKTSSFLYYRRSIQDAPRKKKYLIFIVHSNLPLEKHPNETRKPLVLAKKLIIVATEE